MKANSYAALDKDAPLAPYELDRREPNATDVEVAIEYSGICHSDIHHVRGEWGDKEYPSVPGHEIIGKVTRVGEAVTRFKVGDQVGVGVMVNSCGDCQACNTDYDNYCEAGFTGTYGDVDPIDGSITRGGYSDLIVVTEKFVVPIPESLDITAAAPLLCAGITMYSPLKHWQAGPGKKIGIVGLGGLGHMGVKIAAAMGAEVHVVSSSQSKGEAALSYGAKSVIVSSDSNAMESHNRTFDLLVNTIPVGHDLTPYLDLLAINGTVCIVGAIEPMPSYHGGQVIGGRKSISGSGIGSIAETNEMLEFCAQNNILPEVETITIDKVNEAWSDLRENKMPKRYVIDVANSSF